MTTAERGGKRAAAEQALIAAAADLLGEIGPRATSVRDIAARAGVNHGLVHHYFGGKDGLLREAMKRLVHEHHQFATRQGTGGFAPAPLGLTDDQRYLRAVARCVLDGEMGLARTELDEGVSVPNQVLAALTAMQHLDRPTLEMKADLALAAATEMGWAALEPFLFLVADVQPDEREAVRHLARRRRQAAIDRHLAAVHQEVLA